ncbi:MAG: alpha/beta hydrolase [Saprospiraceae bacterium]|nr:alpha/beta hydrolase [Saprospiraceae bacterium]
MKLYFISGLGVDHRAFKFIQLPSKFEVIHLPWLIPEQSESLESYAKRMTEKIDAANDFSLIGLSFGGVLANEMMDYVKPKHTILISSIASRNELPLHYRIAGAFHLNQFFSLRSMNQIPSVNYFVFGVSSDQDKQLLNEILKDTDPEFSSWAVNQLLQWKREKPQSSILRIHGDQDLVLPITGFTPDHIIRGGGHFMISTKAEEISAILTQILAK